MGGDKGQLIRVIDVLALGPFMVWAGGRLGGPAGDVLAIAGIGTIALNGINYLKEAQRGTG